MSWFHHLTPTERAHRFMRACPEEFRTAVDAARLPDQAAFKALADWDGSYPGPLGWGPTNTAKSRACWVALKRLCITGGMTFTWHSAKQLTERYFKHHMDGEPEKFWDYFTRTELIYLDDIDKIELNERNAGVLFEFYDWVYREHRPMIGTTNKTRQWWTDKMGEATTRRMFDDAHHAVEFRLASVSKSVERPASF